MAIRFTNILKDLIIESSRFQVLFDKFVKPKEKGAKGMMPFETLVAIIAADPTSRLNNVNLNIVSDAGHSASEAGIIDGLVRATDKFKDD
jgi:hypothetical protein